MRERRFRKGALLAYRKLDIMDPHRGRRLLLIAFTCSVALHLLAIHLVRWPLATPVEPPRYVTLSKRMFLPITKATPRPTPPPPLRARPKVSSKIAPPRIARSVLAAVRAATGLVAVPTAAPKVVLPTPALSPHPLPSANGCSQPNAGPAVATGATPPPIPPAARGSNTSGESRIRVNLDSHGVVLSTNLLTSSGDAGLDQVATAMARASTFTPRLVQCRPVASSYAYAVKFVAL